MKRKQVRKPGTVGLNVLVPVRLKRAVKTAALERDLTLQRAGLEAWSAWLQSDPATFGTAQPTDISK